MYRVVRCCTARARGVCTREKGILQLSARFRRRRHPPKDRLSRAAHYSRPPVLFTPIRRRRRRITVLVHRVYNSTNVCVCVCVYVQKRIIYIQYTHKRKKGYAVGAHLH